MTVQKIKGSKCNLVFQGVHYCLLNDHWSLVGNENRGMCCNNTKKTPKAQTVWFGHGHAPNFKLLAFFYEIAIRCMCVF